MPRTSRGQPVCNPFGDANPSRREEENGAVQHEAGECMKRTLQLSPYLMQPAGVPEKDEMVGTQAHGPRILHPLDPELFHVYRRSSRLFGPVNMLIRQTIPNDASVS